MTKRLIVVVALGSLLAACGAAPNYTISQAVIDMPTYEPATQFSNNAYDVCVAKYLFHRRSPLQVKTIIQGAGLGYPPPIMTLAEHRCALLVP